ncbi:MAG: hypothetical protein JW712_05565 [Dehalococcoidales bacterium]|nr:hypothetical protein [Dehalococcoidales bacterium]
METLKTAQIIDIDSKQILSRIGYDEGTEPPARIRHLVDDYIENYHNLIEFAYSYTFRDIDLVLGGKVILGDSMMLESKVIANLCKRCDKVAIFVLTIGGYLEEMVAYLVDSGMVLQATVLDAVGSCAAEQMAGLIEERIKSYCSIQEQCISRRFSPGYCDWNVRGQEVLFQILNDDTAGVSITDEYLMIPRKSVSGIIGVGDIDNGIEEYNPCLTCKKPDCPGRRD